MIAPRGGLLSIVPACLPVYSGSAMARKGQSRFRFLIKPDLIGSNGWLALRGDLLLPDADAETQKRDLARRFSATQVWFSDLDDFDSRSPAKLIAMRAVGAGHWNPAYMRWALGTLLLFLRFGKKTGESMGWKRYYDSFLKRDTGEDWLKEEAFQFIDRLLTPEKIARLLFPGVQEFYAAFVAEKYLVTRNLERIAYRYARVLPYTGYFHEVQDKAAVVEAFLKARPDVRRYGTGGDSAEDACAADALEFHHRKGTIEKPLCLFRADRPFAFNGSFNIAVGRNRAGLAEILAAYR
jgi:hypothetical protein